MISRQCLRFCSHLTLSKAKLLALTLLSAIVIIASVTQIVSNGHYSNFNKTGLTKQQKIVNPPYKATETEFRRRRNLASEECRKIYGHDAASFIRRGSIFRRLAPFHEFTYFDDNYKILFCTVPKVASTSIKKVLQYLAQLHSPGKPIRRLYELSYRDIQSRMNYSKILLVRHPIERLISAWRDKFLRGVPKENYMTLLKYGKHIVRNYKKPPMDPPAITGKEPVTLEEFLKFIQSEGIIKPNMVDEHWRSYVDHCEPCRVDYNYIGHYEHFEQDLVYILNATTQQDVSKKIPGPAVGSYAYESRNKTHPLVPYPLTFMFADNVPKTLFEDITTLYRRDFAIFGYHPDSSIN